MCNFVFHRLQFIIYYISHPKIPVIWLVKRAGIISTVPTKMTMPRAQSTGVERVLCSSRQNHMDARVNVFAQLLCKNRELQPPFSFYDNHLVKFLSNWVILSNLINWQFCSFHFVYKTNIDCFLFGAQFKIIGPWWCQNHDYAVSFTSGIVMVLTSPWVNNFNCALRAVNICIL